MSECWRTSPFKTPSEQGCRNSIAIPADTVCRDLANIVHPDCSAARRFCCRDVLLIHYISHISFRFLPSDWRWRISFPNASAARWISIALCTAPIFSERNKSFRRREDPSCRQIAVCRRCRCRLPPAKSKPAPVPVRPCFRVCRHAVQKFVHRLPHHLLEAVGLGIRIGHSILAF